VVQAVQDRGVRSILLGLMRAGTVACALWISIDVYVVGWRVLVSVFHVHGANMCAQEVLGGSS
jgi:hypothetical protein